MSKANTNKGIGRFDVSNINTEVNKPVSTASYFNGSVNQFSGGDIGTNIRDGYKTHLDLDQLVEAPVDMNFYDKIPAVKMTELVESIHELGLQNPIVVWEQEDGKYMILSGHNRVNAYKILRDTVDEKLYSKIKVEIKKQDELTKNQAKAIIVDTNWVVREMTTMQRAKSIYVKYIELKDEARRLKQRRAINDEVAARYGLGETQILNYKNLVNLIPEFQKMIDSTTLTIDNGVKISKLAEKVQVYMYENCTSKEISKLAKKINPKVTIEDIKNMLSSEEKKYITLKLSVPTDTKEMFMKELELLKDKYHLKF